METNLSYSPNAFSIYIWFYGTEENEQNNYYDTKWKIFLLYLEKITLKTFLVLVDSTWSRDIHRKTSRIEPRSTPRCRLNFALMILSNFSKSLWSHYRMKPPPKFALTSIALLFSKYVCSKNFSQNFKDLCRQLASPYLLELYL